MSKPLAFLGAGLAVLATTLGPASAHEFSDKTIRYTYGGTMQRCAAGGACVSLPFHSITGTVYFTDDKVFDYGLDRSGAGVGLNQKREIPAAGNRTIGLTYGVVGAKFITIYNITDASGALISSVAITITGSGGHCSVDYEQRQAGYKFSPRLATRQCIIVAGKVGK